MLDRRNNSQARENTVVHNATHGYAIRQLATLTSEQREREARPPKGGASICRSTQYYGYAIKYLATLTSEQRERVKHGHLRAVQAYTVVRNATDMQSSNI